jgi:hypothetical protein
MCLKSSVSFCFSRSWKTVCWSPFCHCHQHRRQLIKSNALFCGIERFQFRVVVWAHCFWGRDKAEGHGWGHVAELSCSEHGSQEARNRKRKSTGTQDPLHGHAPVMSLPPTRPRLPEASPLPRRPLSYESINLPFQASPSRRHFRL